MRAHVHISQCLGILRRLAAGYSREALIRNTTKYTEYMRRHGNDGLVFSEHTEIERTEGQGAETMLGITPSIVAARTPYTSSPRRREIKYRG